MTLLSKEELLQQREFPFEEVLIPEWKGSVRIQGLSSNDGDRFLASLWRQNGSRVERDTSMYSAKLLALCIVDAQGKRVLGEADIAPLSQKPFAILARLTQVAERLSGIAANSVETAEKN